MNIFRPVAILGSWTGVSRITGFIRDILMTHFFGASYLVDSFIIAFKLPNLFRRLFAEGALSVAFIPIYKTIYHQHNSQSAQLFAGKMLLYVALFMMILTILAIIFMPQLMAVIAPGFAENPVVFEEAVLLGRICFPYLFCTSLMAIFGGVLNANGRFSAVAIAPIILNLCIIVAFIAMSLNVIPFSLRIIAMAVTCSGIIQLLYLFYTSVKLHLCPTIKSLHYDTFVQQFFILIGPSLLSYGVLQVNMIIGDIIASTTGEGAISWLFYADRLIQLPIGLLGVSLQVSLLSYLSEYIQKNQIHEAEHNIQQSLIMAIGFGVPAGAGLFFLGDEWVYYIFERGAFTANDTYNTAQAMAVFAFAIPFWLVMKIFTPLFFAYKNTKWPFYSTLMSVVCNVTIALSLKDSLGFIAIAYGALGAAVVMVIGLSVGLMVCHHWFYWGGIKLVKTLLCQIPIISLLYIINDHILPYFSLGWYHFIAMVICTLCIIILAYVFLWYLNVIPPLTKLLKK